MKIKKFKQKFNQKSQNLLLILVLAFTTLGFSSCNLTKTADALLKTQSTTNPLTYNLTENGCATGEHTFYSNEQLCEGLKNDSLNNYCGLSLRRSKYRTDCAGRGNW